MQNIIFKSVHKLTEAVLGLMLATMVFLIFVNVVLRYGFNSGISISEELARYIFVWMIFIGAVLAVKERTHLGFDSVVSRLGPKTREFLSFVVDVLILAAMVLFVHGCWKQTVINLPTKSPVSGISMAVLYLPGVIAGVATILVLLVQRLSPLITRKTGGHDRAIERH